ncbi:MAG: Ig-like domain-containing protein, partial [Clostridia bacterium]|nr:Ig-like domain-containing protein [Clostridia bacterium]
MKNLKRYFTLLLSVFMVLGAMGFPAAVSALELPLEQEQLPDKKVIVKFNDAMIAAWKGMEAGTYTEEDGRQITAAKMAPGALNADGQRATKDYPNPRYLLADYGIDTDMSGYRTINFRLYSKAATNEQVNIVLQQTKNGSDGYFKQTITLDWIGWKTFSYHFGDMSPTKAGISEKRIGTIYFNFGGWGTGKTGNAETELAVSEIYLSNPHNEVKLEDGLIAWEAGTTENCTPFTSDSTVTNMHDVSGKMVIDKTGDISLTTPNRHLVVDSQQYQYLNLLVHSNKATTTAGTGINICVFDYAGSNSYVRKNIPVNWTGWKVVSIPLSQFNSSRWNQVKSIRINSGGWSGSVKPVEIGTELNFDLIWFSKEEPNLKLKETIAETGSTEMSAAGAEVSFQFSNPLRRIDETKLTLTKQGETNSESIFCTAEGSTMTLAAQGTLEYGTAYTLTVLTGAVTDIFGQSNTEPITYSFTTMQQGLNATPPTLTDSAGNPLTAMPENGETVKAAARVSNGTSAAKTATLVLAYYDENNTMVDCKTASKSIPANGIDTLEATTTASGTVVKAFVIDDLDAQQPLYNGFVQLPAPASNGGSTGSGENALSLTGVRLEEEQVYINGKVGGALPRVAVIAMRGKTAEEPLFLSPVLAEDGGAFTIETAMPETAASGEYEVRATAYGMEGKQTDTIKYINKNDRDALVADVNAAETAEAVADILMEKREILGLLQDGALFTHIAQTVFEQKLYESYAALIAMLEQAQTVLAKLNAATGTEYSKLLSENPMILNGHADEAYYNDLSVAGKTAVNRKIVSSAPFESFATFRTAFAQAVAAYKQELESGGVQLEDGLVVWEFDSEEKCTLAKLTPDTTVTNMHDVSAKLTIDKTGDINGNTPSRDLVVDRQQYQYLNLVMYSNKATATEGTGINICIHDSSSYARAVLPVNWTGWKVVSIPLSAFAGTIDWNDVKYVKINSGGWSGSVTPVEIGTELNFDLIWFSKEEPSLTLKETIIESENDKMPVNGAEVSFWFSNSLRQVDETALTLTKQGEANSESVSCTVEGSSVTLEAQAELDYGTTYTLTIPSGAVIDIFGQSNTEPITYSFTTLQQGLNATLPTLTDSAGNPLSGRPTSGETIQAVARITNGSLEAKTATLVLVCYDENNRVLVRKTASKSIPANGADTLEVTTAASGAGVKAFVVDDLDSLRPLYNGFAQVPAPTSNGGTTGSGENPSLTLNDIRLEKEQVYITGKVEGALPRMAIIAIDGESAEELLFLSPVMAEDGGAFTMETTMPETAVGGEYEVRATAYSMEGKQTDTFYYFGKGERDALIAAVNAAENAETVTNLLTEKRDILDLPQDSALFTHIVQTVFEQKPYANYAAFAAMLEQAQTMLAKLNAATETEYSKLLSENPMILNGHADEAYYHNLSAKGKTAVNQKIVPIAPFESFATFRIVFARAVAAYKQELESGGIKLEDGLIVWEFDSAEKCTAVNLTPDTTVTNLYDVSAKLTIDRTGDISRNTPSQNLAVDTQQYQYLNLLVHSNKATTTEGTGINICIHDSSSYAR